MEKLITSIELLGKFRKTQSQSLLRVYKLSAKVKEIRDRCIQKLPHHINVISIAARGNLKETAHSAILQQMLLHPFILESFLKKIAEIENSDLNPDQVRPAEAERMDVSIYGKDRCVIIENKVNGAGEQEGQVFRYVHQAMENKEHHYRPENIHVIYLNPTDHSEPSFYSLTEKGKGAHWIPPLIKERMVIKDYSHDIYNWLKDLQQDERLANQPFLLSALHQYQDYLEEKFELTDKFEPMKNDIKDLIDKEILKGLNDEDDKDFSKRIKILEDLKQDLEQLQESIKEYEGELKLINIKHDIEYELQINGASLIDLYKEAGYSDHNFGFKISINGRKGFVLYGGPSTNIYLGFGFNNNDLSESERNYLISILGELGYKNIQVQDLYPCFSYDKDLVLKTLKDKYIEFAKFVIKKSEEPQPEGIKLEIIR